MALYPVKYDTTTGNTVADSSGASGTSYTDYEFISTGQTTFTIGSITALSKIDSYVNGVKMREGASYDWTRNAPSSQVIFNYTIPAPAYVAVRIWG